MYRIGHALSWGWLMALPLAAWANGDGWRLLDGPEIAARLTDQALVYETGAEQSFLASGRTIYRWAETTWGTWRVEADRYCSQWPPSDDWACYDVEMDASGRVRFIDDWGNVSTGEAPRGDALE